MFEPVSSFSGLSTNSLEKTKAFYTNTLGLKLENEEMGLNLNLPGGGGLFIYEKPDHQPATYTVLNFVVKSIDEAVDALVQKGVVFKVYDNMPFKQDEKAIARGLSANMGPDIAWFEDPAGNILAILQTK